MSRAFQGGNGAKRSQEPMGDGPVGPTNPAKMFTS